MMGSRIPSVAVSAAMFVSVYAVILHLSLYLVSVQYPPSTIHTYVLVDGPLA